MQEENPYTSWQSQGNTPHLLQRYDGIIKEKEEIWFIERVHDDVTPDVHYLPHHSMKESATTSIRVVYDCSCCGDSNSTSLNELSDGRATIYFWTTCV